MERKSEPSRRKYLKYGVIAVVVAVVGGVGGWSAWQATRPPPRAIKIGVQASLTGPDAQIGTEMRDGAMMAVEEYNAKGGILGMKIELAIEDDESKPEVGVSAVRKLVTVDNVDAIVGTTHSAVYLASMDVAAEYGVPYIGTGVSGEITQKIAGDLNKYWGIFKGIPSTLGEAATVVDAVNYYIDKGVYKPKTKTFAMIMEDSSYGRYGGADFKNLMEAKGWKCVAEEVNSLGTVDFYPTLTKIKGLNPDLILAQQATIPSDVAIVKQTRELEIPAMFNVPYIGQEPEFSKQAGEASNYVMFGSLTAVFPEKHQDWIKSYKDSFGYEPTMMSALTYDNTVIVLQAIERVGSLDKKKIGEAMLDTDYSGIIAGRYVFDKKNHEVICGEDYLLAPTFQIMDGKGYVIYPPGIAEKDLAVPPYLA